MGNIASHEVPSQALAIKKRTTSRAQRANVLLMAVRYKAELGQAIARRRKELGLTQKDLAELTHYKEAQTVSRWERGENLPGDLEVVATALQWTLPELMAGIVPPDRRTARKLGIDRSMADGGTPQLERIEAQYDRILHELQELKQRVDDRVEMLDTIVRERQETERRLRHMTVDEADEIIRLLQESRNRLGRDVGKRSLRAEPDKDHRAAQ